MESVLGDLSKFSHVQTIALYGSTSYCMGPRFRAVTYGEADMQLGSGTVMVDAFNVLLFLGIFSERSIAF